MRVRCANPRVGRFLCSLLLLGSLLAPLSARAGQEPYTDEDANPLRIVYYFVYPFGKLLEMAVTKPLYDLGGYVSPYHHIDEKRSSACSRERPARDCTAVIH